MRTRRFTKASSPYGFVHPGMTDHSGNQVEIDIRPPATYMGGYVIQGPTYACFDKSAFREYIQRLLEVL